MNKKLFASFLCAGLVGISASAHAIGPRDVTDSGKAVKWATNPVVVDIESDTDVRGKDVKPLITNALNMWSDLTDSDVTFQEQDLGTAIDETNKCTVLYDPIRCRDKSPLSDGKNPLVIDEDGQVVADFFGSDNRFVTLGFASIISFNSLTGAAGKGEAVFNAACLTGIEVSGCERTVSPLDDLSFSDDDFTSFIVHEMGHFLGLDHQQVNLTESTDSLSTNDDKITTMFPAFKSGNGANFKTPELDDRMGLAQLYPASGFASSTWTIRGVVRDTDGQTPLQCANIVVRAVDNPRVEAISALSGDFAEASSDNGLFTVVGLTPGKSYTIDLEAIGSGFLGASGYTPCRGSSGEPAPPSFLNVSSSSQVALTSSGTFTGAAGDEVHVIATVGDDIVLGEFDDGNGGSSSGSSGGGCSLIR